MALSNDDNNNTVPVKLPEPPSMPTLPTAKNKNNISNLINNDELSSLDVYIRWVIESGSIVQKGEKVAQLFYTFHGSPPPPRSSIVASCSNTNNASSSSSSLIIRARARKKRWGSAAAATASTTLPLPSAATNGKTPTPTNNQNGTAGTPTSSSSSNTTTFVTREIRSPSNGFLRVLYKKSFAYNAVSIIDGEYSVLNLILAAIETCEHPAVVGGLCVVCGSNASTRSNANNGQQHCVPADPMMNNVHVPTKKSVASIQRELLPVSVVGKDPKQLAIIEKQKKIASGMAASKEFDDELASFDMDAAISASLDSYAKEETTNNNKQSFIPNKKLPAATATATAAAAVPKQNATKKPVASSMRSLSSLLSGNKAMQKMQQIPQKQKQPQPQYHRLAVNRRGVRSVAMAAMSSASPSSSSSATGGDGDHSKMSKMTVSGGVTITISESEARNISDANSKKLQDEKKLCLVLDLDHTLLHATDDYRAGRFVAEEVQVMVDTNDNGNGNIDDDTKQQEGNGDNNKTPTTRTKNPDSKDDVRSILLPVELPPAQQQQYIQQKLQQQQQQQSNTNVCLSPLPQQSNKSSSNMIIMRHFVKLRPHLKEFFDKISSTYQLSVYTAGTRTYAEQVAVMICRHLVDATYDEEGLNSLRGKVREKEEECKRYREYKARVGRKRQLELAWTGSEEGADEGGGEEKKMDATKMKNGVSVKKKSISFGDDVKKGVSLEESEKDAKPESENTKKEIFNKATVVADSKKASNNSPSDGESSSQKKRDKPPEDGTMQIPRKKKRLNSGGSLLTNIPVETEKKSLEVEEEELMADPTQDRDRLRKELEKAEKLEIAAVELRRKIFGSRIVSRTDVGDLGKDVKSLKRVFPCGGVMAAILDDREDVWANAKNNATGRPGEPPDNLLLVKPYHWKPFSGYADVNNASGQDLSEADDSLSDNPEAKEDDMQLLWTADILKRLHQRYYSANLSAEEREKMTVPSLLQTMRKETFLRFPQVKVVFSGLIPINKQGRQSQIRPHVVRYAEELGAEVFPSVAPEATHVVAARDGSDKIRQARREVPGCYVVHTSWLMECFWSISRRDVRPHHMGPVPTQQHARKRIQEVGTKKDPPSKKSASLLLDGSDPEESEDDDEDFDDDFLSAEMMQG